MKQKKPNSKLQAILFERGIKIVDLYNKIEEENDKPVAKYMISQIVNGKRTNYEIITLNKICKALGVSPNEIIEENPTRFSVTAKSIKSNTKKEKKKSTLSPKMEKHIQDIAYGVDKPSSILDIEATIEDRMRYNPENPKETVEFTDEQNHITRKDTDYSPSKEEELREERIYNESFDVAPEDQIEEEEDDDFGF